MLQIFMICHVKTANICSYFPHWTISAANAKAHWDLFDIQGRDNVLWVGAGPGGGEFVKAVLDYNLLMKQMK